ncbi:hypothetical protein FB567DRAFT_516550 [Paraphoma chrysanthemicola]|uniref:Mid2 domain-containing protein n=1 Tax=Paraphoma chrysanthemicola TaxID=798071 RepID=A0A8K0RD83_9PLEO|nr:hypothetical protein FB567DRAFT_516550 [Paraphoma chrysanthemicola]
MTSVLTAFLPLTTTFTAPAPCWNGPWIYQNVPTTWWKVGGDNVPSCFPPAFPFSNSRIVYSPGICPAGWTSACQRPMTRSGTTLDVTSCCPSSFQCASTSRAVHDWEDQFGCASSYSVNTAAWNMSPDAIYVNSIYQLQVMIVDATTTSSSSSSSAPSSPSTPATLPTPASATPSTSAPISSVSELPRAGSGNLSKGAIAGIAIGALVGAAVIALLSYIAWTVRRQHRRNALSPPSTIQYSEHPVAVEYGAPHYYNTGPTELDSARVHELKA